MGNYRREGKFNNSSRPSMHRAICAECGDSCEVPFKPTGDRPVYCSNCFGKQGGGSSRPNRRGDSRNRRSHSDDRNMYDAGEVAQEIKKLHVKIDELIKILTPPTKKTANKTAVKEVVKKKPAKERSAKAK